MTERRPFSAAATCVWWFASLAACSTVPPFHPPDAADDPDAGPAQCVAETDASFCARRAACEGDITGDDNCGHRRVAACGECGGTDVCLAGTCKAPVCSTFSFPRTTLMNELNAGGTQDAITGVSADGKTVLWQRRTSCSHSFSLWIADSNGVFTLTDLSAHPALAPMSVGEEGALALTSDGLTIIGMSDDGTQFLQSTRPSVGSTAFGPASNADFVALNASTPTHLAYPAISSDGLAFYFSMSSNPDSAKNGLYETVRSSTTVPFPTATKLPGELQTFQSVNAVSSDRMTLFVQTPSDAVMAYSRRSLKAPFTNPNFTVAAPAVPGFRTRPLGDCQTLIANYTTLGCPGEDIVLYSK